MAGVPSRGPESPAGLPARAPRMEQGIEGQSRPLGRVCPPSATPFARRPAGRLVDIDMARRRRSSMAGAFSEKRRRSSRPSTVRSSQVGAAE